MDKKNVGIQPGFGHPGSGAGSDGLSAASHGEKIIYPQTKKVDVVDDYFGTKVADPYR